MVFLYLAFLAVPFCCLLKVKEPPLIYFMSIDKARLRRPVRPGDIVHYRVEKIRSRGRVWRYRGRAVVDGTLAAQAEFSAAILETGSLPEMPGTNPSGA
jgi:3-hydroxymyristoyl/3-hydroxydecanoyl-(acyl carrier protein) dehydratase